MKKKDVFVSTIKGLITGISLWISNISIASMIFSMSSYNNVVNGFSKLNKKNKELFYFAIPIFIGICLGLIAGFHLISYFITKIPLQTTILFIGFFTGGIVLSYKKNKLSLNKRNAFIPLVLITISVMFVLFFGNKTLLIKSDILQVLLIAIISGISALIPSFSYLSNNISGKYTVVLEHFKHLSSFNDVLIILIFVIVFIISILLIAKLIKMFINKNKNNTYLAISSLILVNIVILILQIKPFAINFVSIFTSILAFLWGYIFAKNVEKE